MKTKLIITTLAALLLYGCAVQKPVTQPSKPPVQVYVRVPTSPVSPPVIEPVKELPKSWRDEFKKYTGVVSAHGNCSDYPYRGILYSFDANRFDATGNTNYFITVDFPDIPFQLWKELYTEDGQRLSVTIDRVNGDHVSVSTPVTRDFIQRFSTNSGPSMVRIYSPNDHVTLKIQPSIAGDFLEKCDDVFTYVAKQ